MNNMESNENLEQKENNVKSYDVEGLIIGAFLGVVVAIVGITDILMGIVVGMFVGLVIGNYIKKK